jgi:hypothetical protein
MVGMGWTALHSVVWDGQHCTWSVWDGQHCTAWYGMDSTAQAGILANGPAITNGPSNANVPANAVANASHFVACSQLRSHQLVALVLVLVLVPVLAMVLVMVALMLTHSLSHSHTHPTIPFAWYTRNLS